MRKTSTRENGFSLVETLIVVSIILIVTASALYQSTGSFASYRANAAMDTVSGQLRVARQMAISQRRPVLITINTAVNPPTVTYAVQPDPFLAANTGYEGPPVTEPLPSQTQFVMENGVPDTPMGFGTCSGSPVCIVGACVPGSMYFSPTGQFSADMNGVNTCNGTLFLGIPGQPSTARAVTIMGATGRVRPYTFIGPLNGPPLQVWTE